MKYIMAVLLSAAIASPLYAAPEPGLTAKELFSYCTSALGTVEQVTCASYFAGFVTGAVLVRKGSDTANARFCLPDHFTPTEAIEVFIRQMRTKGKVFEDEGAPLFVVLAFTSEFPCPNSN